MESDLTVRRASERAIDSARARARGDFRVKNDTRDSLRALSPLEIPRLPRRRDRRNRQLSVRDRTWRYSPKDRAKSERCYRSSRSFSSTSTILAPFFSALHPLVHPARAANRGSPAGSPGAAYLNHISQRAKVCLPFFRALSRGSLFHCRRRPAPLTFLSSRSTAADSRFFDLRVI